MFEYNEITLRKYIIFEGEPYEVLASHVFRKQQRKPVNATKLRNLLSGRVVEYSFHQNEKVEEALITKRNIKYLYSNRNEYWFSEENDPSKRFKIDQAMLGDNIKFLKQNSLVEAMIFDEKIVGITLPIKVELRVTEAAPGIKGDTAKGGIKQVKLETGATINAPLFINEDDILRINTETGEYVDRVAT